MAFLIMAVSFLVFSSALENQFTNWDDDSLIVNNERIRSLHPENLIGIFDLRSGGTYQPLRVFSYALDYSFFGLNPKGYIFHSILLHSLASVFLYLSLIRLLPCVRGLESLPLSEAQYIAVFTALLFAVHPVNCEAVVWLSGRKYVLLAFFGFLSLWLYLKGTPSDGDRFLFLAGAGLAMIASTLSSPFGVAIPLLFFLTDYARDTSGNPVAVVKKNIRRYLPVACIGVVLFCLLFFRLVSRDSGASIEHYTGNPFLTVWTMLRVLFDYVRNLIFPVWLNNRYPDIMAMSFFRFKTVVALIILIAAVSLAFRMAAQKRKSTVLCVFWFILLWLPASNIIPVSIKMADRYIYLASPGFFLGVALGITILSRRIPDPLAARLKLMAALGVLIGFSVLTFNRNQVWKNSGTLWTDSLKKEKMSFVAHNNLGVHLMYAEKKPQEAVRHFQKALDLSPEHEKTVVLQNYCPALFLTHRFSEAYTCLHTYLEWNPDDAQARNQLGIISKKLGKYKEAIAQYRHAVRLKPDFVKALYNMGVCFEAMQNPVKAKEQYETVLKIKPDHFESLLNLGNILMGQGEIGRALEYFRAALAIKPKNPNLLFNLGIACMGQKEYAKAIRYFSMLLERVPTDKEALFLLARAYMATDELKPAQACLEKALEIDPLFSRAANLLKLIRNN